MTSPLHRFGTPQQMSILVLLAASCMETAPAPPKQASNETVQSEGAGIFDTAEEVKARRDTLLARELKRSIEAMPGVVRARVHLTTPSTSILTRRRGEKSGAAVMLVRDNTVHPTKDEIGRFVAAAVPGIALEAVEVFVSNASSPERETVFVGPLEVVASSALLARLVLGGLLGLCIVASCGLILAGIRLRAVRKTVK